MHVLHYFEATIKHYLFQFTASKSKCEATNNGKTKDCIFGFQYKGKDYDECTLDHAFEDGKPWCAIKTTGKNNVVMKEDRWICEPGCPGTGKIFYK